MSDFADIGDTMDARATNEPQSFLQKRVATVNVNMPVNVVDSTGDLILCINVNKAGVNYFLPHDPKAVESSSKQGTVSETAKRNQPNDINQTRVIDLKLNIYWIFFLCKILDLNFTVDIQFKARLRR